MNAICAVYDRQMPIRYENIQPVERADFGVAHVVASESGHEATVRFEDEHKARR